eukprot:2045360-Rhodomonas_salina.2
MREQVGSGVLKDTRGLVKQSGGLEGLALEGLKLSERDVQVPSTLNKPLTLNPKAWSLKPKL